MNSMIDVSDYVYDAMNSIAYDIEYCSFDVAEMIAKKHPQIERAFATKKLTSHRPTWVHHLAYRVSCIMSAPETIKRLNHTLHVEEIRGKKWYCNVNKRKDRASIYNDAESKLTKLEMYRLRDFWRISKEINTLLELSEDRSIKIVVDHCLTIHEHGAVAHHPDNLQLITHRDNSKLSNKSHTRMSFEQQSQYIMQHATFMSKDIYGNVDDVLLLQIKQLVSQLHEVYNERTTKDISRNRSINRS